MDQLNHNTGLGDDVHVLVINLGRGQKHLPPPGYLETSYVMPNGRECRCHVAGLALWWWLRDTGRDPTGVLFACTDTAWQDKAEAVRAEADRLGLPFERHHVIHHEVPRTQELLWKVLPDLEEWLAVQSGGADHAAALHLDVTHAFRAIPLAHTWLALYLCRRGLVTPGVWGYGAFDPERPERTPYLDLSHFLQLAEWAEAVRAFRERLDTSAVARLLDPLEREARRGQLQQDRPAPPGQLAAALRAARAAGGPLQSGLPLETGVEIRSHLGNCTAQQVQAAAAALLRPHADLAFDLAQELERFAVAQRLSSTSKAALDLSEAEIERQLRLVEAWARAGKVDTALRAFRELIVNRVLLAWGCEPGTWLSRSRRAAAAGRLNALAGDPEPRPLTADERLLKTLWREIRSRRNPFAHAGMQGDTVNVGEAGAALLRRLLDDFRRLAAMSAVWLLESLPEVGEKEDRE